MLSDPRNHLRIYAALQQEIKKLLGNYKNASRAARMGLALPLFLSLIIGLCFTPLFRARAAGQSSAMPSASRSFVSAFDNFNLLPRLTRNFALLGDTVADLGVTKSSDSDFAAAGSNVTYTIQVLNAGPDDAVSATLTDTLPANMTFVSLSSPAGWSCSTPSVGAGGTVTCTNPSLTVTSGEQFTLVANISAQAEPGISFTNTASVSTATFDSNDENNSSSTTTTVSGAKSTDIGVSKTAPNSIKPNADLTYTIVVSNGSSDSADNLSLQDTLPGNLTFVSLTQNSGPTLTCTTPAVGSGGTIDCSRASYPGNSSTVLTIVAHVPSGTPAGTTYFNTAIVSGSTPDPNNENNSSSIETTVVTCDSSPVVTSNADSGAGTLRQAIQDTCAGDTITFAPGFTGPITLTSGELLINKNLSIEWKSLSPLTIQRSTAGGTPQMRIFHITYGATVGLTGLAITQGSLNARGGGILNEGTLTLTSSTVSNNSASGGGGIHNEGGTLQINSSTINNNTDTSTSPSLSGGGISTINGTVTILNSTVKNNTSGGNGGGLYNSGSTVTIVGATFNNNQSNSGAGIYNDGLTLAKVTKIFNSTISTNTGGGVANNSGTLTVANSTIANNTGGAGGASNTGSGVFNVGNTIIAGNSTSGASQDVNGSFTSQGFNLIGKSDGSSGFTNGVNGDQVGTTASPLNARLGPLASNGGPTLTHALLAGSPALDAGNNALIPADVLDQDNDGDTGEPSPYDQRGTPYLRVKDSSDADTTQTVDVGAYEAQISVTDIPDQTTPEDVPITVDFNVGDITLIKSVTATSSNTGLVPNSSINIFTNNGSAYTLQITPAANLSGTTTITVIINGFNGETVTDTFLLTVTPVNDSPQASDDSYATNENTQLSVAAPGVLANDTDVDGPSMTAVLVGNPANGSVTLNPDGSFVYKPKQGFSGTDSFTYKVTDGTANSNTATVTITVNEGGVLQFNNATYSVAENGGSATITITRTGGSAGTATVLFSTSNGTAGASDYTSVSQTVTFNAGETTKTVSVPITDDAIDEADETINLTLSNAGGTGQLGAQATATLTITDNDPQPSLSINNVSLAEGNSGTTSFNFTVSLSAASGLQVTVNFATADGTATAVSDYQPASGILTFAPGETTKKISVNVSGDTYNEPDETFFVNLTNGVNAAISGSKGTGTIQNDDPAPTISISNASIVEGDSGTKSLNFTVTMSANSIQQVSVNYATADGTATAGSDYQSTSGTLTFVPFEVSKTITVLINGDTSDEPNETFFVNLTNPQNATLANAQATGTIVNDDASLIQFTSSAYSGSEGAGHIDITVVRSGNDLTKAASVEYDTSDLVGFPSLTPCQAPSNGHASERCDYTTAAGMLTFAPNETQKTIRIVVTDDAYVEPSEQFSIALGSPKGAVVGSIATAFVLIDDNDSQPATTNPIDNLDFFIRQQYADFLGREPDAAGFAFWKARMTNNCPAGQTCDRIDTALRFFSSDEFKERGYFVYLFYHAALGRRPTYGEWILAVSKLNGPKTVPEQEAAKSLFIQEFISSQEFMNLYNGAQTGQAFVDALIQKSGVTPASRQTLINNYNTVGRAGTLRAFIETPEVQAAFVDRGFVTMLYFGFLRRDAEPGGFDFWLQKLNQTNKDYRFIVGGFINSDEYRFRFAQIPANP